MAIEVSKTTLEQYGLGFDEVVQAVQRSSLDLPGGSVRSPEGEILLRATGEANDARAFAAIALKTLPDGTRLSVGDVAEVIDGFAETDQRASFDGRPAILLTVFRMGDQKALDVAAAAEAHVERVQAEVPEGLEVTVWQNVADHLGDRIGSMISNGRGGLLLVLGAAVDMGQVVPASLGDAVELRFETEARRGGPGDGRFVQGPGQVDDFAFTDWNFRACTSKAERQEKRQEQVE